MVVVVVVVVVVGCIVVAILASSAAKYNNDNVYNNIKLHNYDTYIWCWLKVTAEFIEILNTTKEYVFRPRCI